MRKSIIFFILFALGGCTAKINQEAYSDYKEQTIMMGEVNWEGLTQQPYAEWFKPNYLDYQVDAASLAAIDDKINDVEIVVFMGTWCEDSQLQVPQFYKILDHLGYDLHKMRVVAIDREEEGLIITPEAAEYKIEFVPTFIFYRNGKELGRISEYPVKTIEKDMVAILTK
jgi:thiol-disulfide isomerase/thioredoxin